MSSLQGNGGAIKGNGEPGPARAGEGERCEVYRAMTNLLDAGEQFLSLGGQTDMVLDAQKAVGWGLLMVALVLDMPTWELPVPAGLSRSGGCPGAAIK
jgi:hypothetical protein